MFVIGLLQNLIELKLPQPVSINRISIQYIFLNRIRDLSVGVLVDVETQVDVWCEFSTEYYGQLSLHQLIARR